MVHLRVSRYLAGLCLSLWFQCSVLGDSWVRVEKVELTVVERGGCWSEKCRIIYPCRFALAEREVEHSATMLLRRFSSFLSASFRIPWFSGVRLSSGSGRAVSSGAFEVTRYSAEQTADREFTRG